MNTVTPYPTLTPFPTPAGTPMVDINPVLDTLHAGELGPQVVQFWQMSIAPVYPAVSLGLFILLVMGLFFGAAAHATDAYFEALYDVPIMAGLEEVKEQAMLFDKPGGRIASVVGVSKTVDATRIEAFYDQSLPQLGWKKVEKNQYVRGEDRLVLELVRRPPVTVLHFTLSPLRP